MPAQDVPSTGVEFERSHKRPRTRKPRLHSLPATATVVKSSCMAHENHDLEVRGLNKLLSLLNHPVHHKQTQAAEIDCQASPKSLQWPSPQRVRNADQTHETNEVQALEQFTVTRQNERQFTNHPHRQLLSAIFTGLLTHRLANKEWTKNGEPENVLRVLTCLRIFMRDPTYQRSFMDLGGVKVLARLLQMATDSYLTYGDGPCVVDILKEMTNIFQKLSAVVSHRQSLVDCGVHKSLVLLLSANDVIVLHCTLHGLISLAQSPQPRAMIAELNSVETVLRILQEYDTLSKKLAAHLLTLLCDDPQAVNMIKVFDGVPLLLSLLHSESLKLLWHALWCLVQLAKDQEMSNEIRALGGIPLLLSLLHDRKFVSERAAASGLASASVRTPEEVVWQWPVDEGEGGEKQQSQEMKEHQLTMKSACCACLTELVLNDTNAQQIVQSNGIYSIGLLILPRDTTDWTKRDRVAFSNLQAGAFRALRFLFSMERNRRLFKRLFPPALFEMFIDIGHYNRAIDSYRPLVDTINSLEESCLEEIAENLNLTDHNKEPSKYIGDYAVMELLGSGGFGSVYKVKKKTSGQSYLAMKEINTQNMSWGKSNKERQQSVGDALCELTIIKEQLKHPNIVRYHKTFFESDKLYIVMELIEGAPIGEHFNSLKEKREHFSEVRIWRIFIQMVLALRYLHKEKGIVHRDLTPNNIMLGENDKVTITDFGLAKQKQKDCSKMTSVVGTILYSCPEILQSQPYSEKADVWALGCVLYQMCTLNPPFYTSNMLSLATKIVEADYEPVPASLGYSDLLISTIKKCITVDPSERPDIVGVASIIAEKILLYLDDSHRNTINLEKRLERERRRTQKHYYEANKNMQDYHRLFHISQERYDKLVNLASSGGASSIKDEAEGVEGASVSADTPSKTPNSSTGTAVVFENTDTETEESGMGPAYGWTSDDEMCSSGSEGMHSRENSGSVSMVTALQSGDPRLGQMPRPPEASSGGGGHYSRTRRSKAISQTDINPHLAQQLYLEIPGKYSRDSGFSSGDPSPNASSPPEVSDAPKSESAQTTLTRPRSYPGGQRSACSPVVEGLRKGSATTRSRPNSATPATLTISPRKVREINDPTSQILYQLHKIIYVTQLPPTLCHNPKRKIVEQFKRLLFDPQSTSFNLKTELKKLQIGSQEVIDLHFGSSESQKLARQISQEQTEAVNDRTGGAVFEAEADGEMINYEQMQTIIESVLVESGYYDMSPQGKNRTFPLAPPGAPSAFYVPPKPFKPS